MAKQIQLTEKGFKALKDELVVLLETKRPQLIERLSNARSQGDLSENSDYQNAKEELGFLEGRIDELNDVIKNAKIVASLPKSGSGAGVGAKVTVRVNGIKNTFEIVGEWEADPVNRKISPTSPLGSALIGKKVGEKLEVEAPAGKVLYEILAIE
ncbi:transcription elongation factor GreA [Candidatus Woesebacteria bacterium RIFOXYC1_FULL_31_51]|uniref:Transcription elongation factor GreA n=1 Tax=Candidatus Woesebacteria bacterium GW2011_GWC2_31_9 TaxID=1618586 RepID=A0A0F9YHK7_9BACT|nr:MAG: transcription elongation factor GreA, transcription elongation factor GreA [Candidatus Woesebacteria bacterium GW2011_GWF1_31_35]KKP23415.1 MAG: Transcription elongation factor GreA [Candidatus Woesebacteria bacterium GW2011_GWC1_30_29]KKP26392.1 MAG: Transcription elongation factor GreA [Candidatus Woesebacteria bacterium GW2011_GWD1_31_12]KKP27691.1 MAG: Transcription elongation factor GreA [Candidatus Woesebacteria bacterium GW2011_GWB1_31_29]KKP30908.1 MAG: Transcription elongation 